VDSPPSASPLPSDYPRFLAALKERIRAARLRATLSVNRELIALYWQIGGDILKRRRQEGWGKATVLQLSRDLTRAFPDMSGFSPKNIWRMRAFYLAWSERPAKVAQAVRLLDSSPPGMARLPRGVADIPWGHNVVLVQRLKKSAERAWYARMTVKHGWSRRMLIREIDSRLHRRQGKAQTNFSLTLPETQAKLAQEALKDEYALDFLAAGVAKEKEEGLRGNGSAKSEPG
jgi:predicted nuclease of restriction endonuclease-like (RecB) superfamily